MLIVLTTVATAADADTLARRIVESKLAACVQIVPQMTSIYSWQGRVESDAEHLLVIKTLDEKFDELNAFITANHSYEVPEIVAISADKVSEAYLGWLRENLTDKIT